MWYSRLALELLFAGVTGPNSGPVSLVLNGDNSKFELQLNDDVNVKFFPASIFSGDSVI